MDRVNRFPKMPLTINSFQNKKTVLQGIFGLSFGAFCLWLALRLISFDEIGHSLSQLDYSWVAVAAVLYCLNLSVRVIRWRLLLRQTIKLSYSKVAAALVIGYMVNSLLPARLGELYRADYMKRRHAMTRSAALGSIVVERMLDGIAIVIIFNFGLVLSGIPSEESTILLTISILASAIFFGLYLFVRYFSYFKKLLGKLPVKWLESKLDNFSSSLTVVRQRSFIAPVLVTVLIYVLESATLACALKSTGIELAVYQNFVVLGAVVLGTLIPTAPAFVGSIQLSFIVTLGAFGMGASSAFVAATAYQIFPLMLVVAAGLTIITFQAFKDVAVTRKWK
jgi:glycosyltransferase 2 family protein